MLPAFMIIMVSLCKTGQAEENKDQAGSWQKVESLFQGSVALSVSPFWKVWS